MRFAQFHGIYFRASSLSGAVNQLRCDHYRFRDDDEAEGFWPQVKEWAHIQFCRLTKRRNRYEWKDYDCQRHILADLRDYVRLGFGYSLPRAPDAIPEFIPLDVWDGLIDWERSAVSGGGREFVDVRIVPLWTEEVRFGSGASIDARVQERIKEVLAGFIPVADTPPADALGSPPFAVSMTAEAENISTPEEKPQASAPGRPSRKPEIEAAFAAIAKDYSKPLKEHYAPTRAEAKRLSGNDSDTGLSDDAIRKFVTPLWNNERQNPAAKL